MTPETKTMSRQRDWLSPDIEIRSSPIEGAGLFARVDIKRGKKVFVKGGA
jgi:hypothetical protein